MSMLPDGTRPNERVRGGGTPRSELYAPVPPRGGEPSRAEKVVARGRSRLFMVEIRVRRRVEGSACCYEGGRHEGLLEELRLRGGAG